MAEDCLVLQEEEREALLSIYDGDEAFKQVSSTIYQYKVIPSLNVSILIFI